MRREEDLQLSAIECAAELTAGEPAGARSGPYAADPRRQRLFAVPAWQQGFQAKDRAGENAALQHQTDLAPADIHNAANLPGGFAAGQFRIATLGVQGLDVTSMAALGL